jgi:3-hydroxyisobutyrate dehydrogenase-like beta-hydroxyacid dehydrogenase
MKVAILGAGLMGHALARRLLGTGNDVTVWNRTPEKAADLVSGGAHLAASVADAASGADVVAVVLADDGAVRSVCEGETGAFAHLRDGGVLVNHSTISERLAAELEQRGPAGRVVNAAIVGTPRAVENGQAQFLTGGAGATVERLGPYWDSLAGKRFHCGDAARSAAMKLVANLLLLGGMGVASEAIVTARASGIADDLLRSFFTEAAAVPLTVRLRLDNLLADEHPSQFFAKLGHKDVELARVLATDHGVELRLAEVVSQMLREVIDSGRGEEDIAAIIEAVKLHVRAGRS